MAGAPVSRRLQDLFWDCDLSGTEQLVAQRLAWHANDEDGRCWPGMRSLSEKTGLSERAIQNATKALEAAGHITRRERPGAGMVYVVHPRTTCTPTTQDEGTTPAADAPPRAEQGAHEVHPRTSGTPAADAGTPARRAPKQVKNREDTDDDLRDAAALITGQRGRRIDHDWQPTKPLPDDIAKVVAGWPPGRLDEVLIEFRDWWIAEPGKRATKADWDRTWWNRLRQTIGRDREREERRNGQRSGGGWQHRPRHPGGRTGAALANALGGVE